jgi:shikimate dehydrogenase
MGNDSDRTSTRPALSARTRVAAVIGWPIEHSKSPAMHNAAFAALGIDGIMIGLGVPPSDLVVAVRGLAAARLLGASVTAPHKEAVFAACDEVTPLAARIGAVNCVVFTDGRILGDNTDAPGFVDGLGDAHPDRFAPASRPASAAHLAGERALLLGGGGAARAVAAGLADAGCSVTVVARSPDRVTWTCAAPWDELSELAPSCDLLVDCTSVGLTADGDTAAAITSPVPIDALPPTATVATLVYHRDTLLLAAARARGLRTVDGRGMLAHQGARAFALWTGQAPPVDRMVAALLP